MTYPKTACRTQIHKAKWGLTKAKAIEKFGGRPVGLQTIASATSEEMETIEEVCEPYLLQLGFIERTPRGRIPTPRAYEHLGKAPPQDTLI